jgi:hypothetical protein
MPRGIPGSGTKAGKSTGATRGGPGKSLAAISKRGEALGENVGGLIADCQAAIAAQAEALAALDQRNRALLKSMVKSRRQVQKMTAGLKAQVAGQAEVA